ncbi:hypothetical protein BSL78_12405 [Apostichopus japonicus]|uniref:Uncharacterized protein n=1 Tax=Stichopus japonicus TaxID=307972 RepID=A0A2G8KRT3_STIJA|nr:hypothetical protein BSL78_12405 [Apostichopus japonicus]
MYNKRSSASQRIVTEAKALAALLTNMKTLIREDSMLSEVAHTVPYFRLFDISTRNLTTFLNELRIEIIVALLDEAERKKEEKGTLDIQEQELDPKYVSSATIDHLVHRTKTGGTLKGGAKDRHMKNGSKQKKRKHKRVAKSRNRVNYNEIRSAISKELLKSAGFILPFDMNFWKRIALKLSWPRSKLSQSVHRLYTIWEENRGNVRSVLEAKETLHTSQEPPNSLPEEKTMIRVWKRFRKVKRYTDEDRSDEHNDDANRNDQEIDDLNRRDGYNDDANRNDQEIDDLNRSDDYNDDAYRNDEQNDDPFRNYEQQSDAETPFAERRTRNKGIKKIPFLIQDNEDLVSKEKDKFRKDDGQESVDCVDTNIEKSAHSSKKDYDDLDETLDSYPQHHTHYVDLSTECKPIVAAQQDNEDLEYEEKYNFRKINEQEIFTTESKPRKDKIQFFNRVLPKKVSFVFPKKAWIRLKRTQRGRCFVRGEWQKPVLKIVRESNPYCSFNFQYHRVHPY